MRIFKTLFPYNNCHIYVVLILMIIVSIEQPFLLFLIFPYLLYLRKLSALKTAMIVGAFFLLCFSLAHQRQMKLPINLEGPWKVTEIKTQSHEQTLIIKQGKYKLLVRRHSEPLLSIGDVILISGELNALKSASIPGGYDEIKHLRPQNINAVVLEPKIEIIAQTLHINQIREHLLNHLRSYDPTIAPYLEALIIGEKSFNTDQTNAMRVLGIAHLFAISGLHVSILALGMRTVLTKMQLSSKTNDVCIIIFLSVFIVITGFLPSVVRASMMVILYIGFKRYQWPFTTLDMISLTFIFHVCISPLVIYSLGFQLSYLVAFGLILSSRFMLPRRPVISLLRVTMIAHLITLPIAMQISPEYHLVSIFTSPIYVMFFSMIIFPVTLLVFFVQPLSFLLSIAIASFEQTMFFFSTRKLITVLIPSFNLTTALIYYFVLYTLFVCLEKSKKVFGVALTFAIYLFLMMHPRLISPAGFVLILDAGQGDGIIIVRPFDQCNIVIDNFGFTPNVLNHYGIRRIDIMILTHGHYDHMANTEDILTTKSVTKLLYSFYDTSKAIEPYHNKKNAYSVKSGDFFYCGDIRLDILGPIEPTSNLNNASVVVQTTIDSTTYLFTGDIEIEAEKQLLAHHRERLKSDVIKIAHHGSRTSSHLEFIEAVNPDVAVISVGRYNRFGFPHQSVLDCLENKGIEIHLTSQQGSYLKKDQKRWRIVFTIN